MPFTGVDMNNDQTLDLWKVTLASYEWEDKQLYTLFPLHQFVVTDQMFAKDRVVPYPGTELKWQVVYRENGTMVYIRPGEVRTRSTTDVITEANLPWIGAAAQHSQLAAEVRRNAGRAQLKKLVKQRRGGAKMDMAKSLESRAWGLPSTSENRLPHGFPYWFVPITGAQVTAGTGAGDHQGQNPSGFNDCAGIDASSATFSRWRSYNATWSNSNAEITETDLERMGRMWRRLHFRGPTIADDIKQPKFQRLRTYADETIIDSFSRTMRRGLDDIGVDPTRGYGAGLDLAGEPVFKGLPIYWVEELDTADTTNRGANPLYMTNLEYFRPVIEVGTYFREDVPMRTVDQPDTFTTWIDLNFNFQCTDRQAAGGLISYVAAA